MTVGLIVVNAFVFLFELSNTRGLDAVFYQWGIVPCSFTGHVLHAYACLCMQTTLPSVVDVPAWRLDAHHREYVVPLDLW